MSSQPVSFWRLLDGVERLRLRGKVELWQAALIASQDLRAAAERGDVAAARTAIACATLHRWPVSAEIPDQVRATLEHLGVRVAW